MDPDNPTNVESPQVTVQDSAGTKLNMTGLIDKMARDRADKRSIEQRVMDLAAFIADDLSGDNDWSDIEDDELDEVLYQRYNIHADDQFGKSMFIDLNNLVVDIRHPQSKLFLPMVGAVLANNLSKYKAWLIQVCDLLRHDPRASLPQPTV